MRTLLIAVGAALVLACATTPDAQESLRLEEAERENLLLRLQARLAAGPDNNPDTLMNTLEHLLPAWHAEHRRGRTAPLERELTITVVPNFETIAEMYETGLHERQLVAAWSLGFSRVPENDLGILSRHQDAIGLIMPRLETAPDDLMRNQLLAIWLLAEPTTPVPPLVDIVVNHHDSDVRANAMLALSVILDEQLVEEYRNAVLVALDDQDAKVRLHAASIARHYPDPAFTVSMEARLAVESMPLVRANLAAALGAAGARSAAPLLVPMLNSPRKVESENAHEALVQIFGKDYGMTAEEWQSVLDG